MRLHEAVQRRGPAPVALGVSVLLTFGVLAALGVDPDEAPQQVKAAAPLTTTPPHEPDPVEDTTTTSTPATTTAPAPTTVTAAAPSSRPRTTATTAPRSTKSSAYPGGVSFPFQAGRTSWSATSNGYDMSVTVDNPRPKNGEAVTFTLTLNDNVRKCCVYGFSYGDGGPSSTQQGDCPAPDVHSITTKHTRAYNKAGRWMFSFSAHNRDCAHYDADQLRGYLYGWIEVAPGGTSTSQGPSLPTFRNGAGRYGPTQYDNDPSYTTVHAQVSDEDGYVSKLVIDYGDGATETVPETQMGCRPSDGGWPQGSFLQTPNNPPPTHQYASPGTYKVTVTAYSQGCDGRDVQTASASFQHVYPG